MRASSGCDVNGGGTRLGYSILCINNSLVLHSSSHLLLLKYPVPKVLELIMEQLMIEQTCLYSCRPIDSSSSDCISSPTPTSLYGFLFAQ